MLKNQIIKQNKIELKLTLGENLRNAIIKAGIKTAEESAYAASNNTDKLIKLAEGAGGIIDRGTELAGGGDFRQDRL